VKESEYGSVDLTFFYITQTSISMYNEKVLGDPRVMKDEGLQHQDKFEKNGA
jgi:hypothetical protein